VPTARLSTGKTVAPLHPPRMHTLRGVRLSPVNFFPFPLPDEIVLKVEDSVSGLRVTLGDRTTFELPAGDLVSAGVESLPGALEKPWIADEPLLPTGAGPALGGRVARPGGLPGDAGSLLVPAAQQPAPVKPWELTLPLVERSGLEGDAPAPGEPVLRPYQVEAAQALVAQDSLLLADDPGTGKTAAACVALQTLAQRGWARRILVACLEHELRPWAWHLQQWSPALKAAIVRGDRMQRAQRWKDPGHVFLIGYEALADDILHGTLDPPDLDFDVAILDSALLVADFPDQVRSALGRLRARRRWALAGSRPEDDAEWLAIFGFLTGDPTLVRRVLAEGDQTKRFETSMLRRTRSQLAGQLPPIVRSQLWITLSREDQSAYEEVLAEERHRLMHSDAPLGQQDLEASYARLADAAALGRSGRLGAKAQAAVDLLAGVTAAGHKAIVVTRPEGRGQERLRSALDALGVAVLSPLREADGLREDVETFLNRPSWHVLLSDLDTLEKAGSLAGIGYLLHFASDWNPARRRMSEAWILERSGAGHTMCITELFTLGTVEERLARLLDERGWPVHSLREGASAQEVASALTMEDWLQQIFEVDITTRKAPQPERVPEPTAGPAPRPAITTGMLPGTDFLRSNLQELPPEGLLDGVARWVKLLGFDEVTISRPADETGGELTAKRTIAGQVEQVLVRCVRSDKNVGVAEAKALLDALGPGAEWLGGYLVTTSDFTPACKKLADKSAGQLALVSGAELWRHLHIQGLV
jgi:hypothetical protein